MPNEKNLDRARTRDKKKFRCYCTLNWENASVSAIRKGPYFSLNKALFNTLGMWLQVLIFQGCLIHIDLQDLLHFDSLILLNTFLCNFSLVFWLATLTFVFPAFAFCIFESCVLVFCRNSIFYFIFCKVNFECGSYIAVDNSLVYSYSKFFDCFSV